MHFDCKSSFGLIMMTCSHVDERINLKDLFLLQLAKVIEQLFHSQYSSFLMICCKVAVALRHGQRSMSKQFGNGLDCLAISKSPYPCQSHQRKLSNMIFSWMREKKVTFYDAACLAAAHSHNAVLVTAHQSLARKMGDVQGLCLLQALNP
jgi:predicted nucleic acid-binding protein